MLTQRRSLLLGLAAVALAGCASSPSLFRIQDPSADLHAYRTFAFLAPSSHPSIIERRLFDATRRQLEQRGYVFDDDVLVPDLLVSVRGGMEERHGLRRAPGYLPGSEGVETEDYREGRLGIDLIDSRRREVIWSGLAEGRLSDAMLRDTGAAADKAVAKIFEGFPIKAGTRASETKAPAP